MRNYILIFTTTVIFAVSTIYASVPPIQQWKLLRAASGSSFDASSEEAGAIVSAIIAQDVISKEEVFIVREHALSVGGPSNWNTVAATIASKSLFAAAAVKAANQETTGWTSELIEANLSAAATAAALPFASQEFRQSVFNILKTQPVSRVAWGGVLFKEERAKLSSSEQKELTKAQVDLIIALPNRKKADNSWMAEMAADLIALELAQ